MATRYGTSWPVVMATTLFHPGEGTNTFLESYYVSIFLIKPEFVFRISVSLLENMSKVAVTGTVAITGQGRAGGQATLPKKWTRSGEPAACGHAVVHVLGIVHRVSPRTVETVQSFMRSRGRGRGRGRGCRLAYEPVWSCVGGAGRGGAPCRVSARVATWNGMAIERVQEVVLAGTKRHTNGFSFK